MKDFLISFITFFILVILFYGFIPALVWVFGGEFQEVSTNDFYMFVGGIGSFCMASIVMQDFYNAKGS